MQKKGARLHARRPKGPPVSLRTAPRAQLPVPPQVPVQCCREDSHPPHSPCTCSCLLSSSRTAGAARSSAWKKSFRSMREKKGKARADADGHVLVPPRPRRSSRALSFAQRRKMMARRWFDVSELDRSFARAERGKAKEGARRRAELMRICREGLWSVMAPG
jgi:hypothetical protein